MSATMLIKPDRLMIHTSITFPEQTQTEESLIKYNEYLVENGFYLEIYDNNFNVLGYVYLEDK